MSRSVEFWPDYGDALLYEDGTRRSVDDFDVPEALVSAIGRWLGQYDDLKLDPATRDAGWIAEGQELFERLRDVLAREDVELFDWEGYWDPKAGPSS